VYRKHVTRNWDCSCLIMTHKNVHLCFKICRVVIGDLNIEMKIKNLFKTYNGFRPILGIYGYLNNMGITYVYIILCTINLLL